MWTSKALSQSCLWQSPRSRQGIAKNKNKSRPRFRNFPEVCVGRPDLCMVPHNPSPPFIPHMQRLRCRAKVKAKALKPHTPGCGACTDIDVMCLRAEWAASLSQKKNPKKQKEFCSPERRHPAPTHAQFLLLHFDIMAIIWEVLVLRWLWCFSCAVNRQNRIIAPSLARAPRLPFLEAFSSPHKHPRGFFFSLSPPRPPLPPHPPILYFPK